MSEVQPRSLADLVLRVEQLERAVKPFAEFAGGFAGRPPAYCVSSTALGAITVGDLRRAAAALAG